VALAHHITLRLTDGRVLAPSVAARRIVARAVLELAAAFRLIVFRAADTHLHLLVACSAGEASELARRLEIKLQGLLRFGVRFDRARIRPVVDQAHLRNAFHYVLRQQQHHGLEQDPLFEASNLPDLLGLRLIGAFTRNAVRELLPRVKRGDLLQHLGGEFAQAPLDLADAADSAAAALALIDLAGRGREAVLARAAGVRLLRPHASQQSIARAFRMTERGVRSLLRVEVDPMLVRAIELQMRLRAALRSPGWAAAG
jgi:hypothetical protein